MNLSGDADPFFFSGRPKPGRKSAQLFTCCLECFLRTLDLGHIPHRAECAARPARLILNGTAEAMYEPDLAIRPNHAILHVKGFPSQCSGDGLGMQRPILRLDHLFEVPDRVLRRQSEDSVGFLRADDFAALGIALPMADMRDPLRFGQLALAAL